MELSTLQTIRAFEVLDRREVVQRHALLEASAGTGKTFAIENIVVRMLIEERGSPPLTIDKILVVTFTRAATRDLKHRIRTNLERTLAALRTGLLKQAPLPAVPDYLAPIFEAGEGAIKQAKRQIEQALFTYDGANIFTIHGFCWRMLKRYSVEAGVSLQTSSSEEQSLSSVKIHRAIRDFIRTEIREEMFTQGQLERLLKWAKFEIETLHDKLYRAVTRGAEIRPPPPLPQQMELFRSTILRLKSEFGLDHESIISAYNTLSPYYNKLSSPECLQAVERFSGLFRAEHWDFSAFDLLVEDGLFIIEAFDQGNLKKKFIDKGDLISTNPALKALRDHLSPLVGEIRSVPSLFARMSFECQRFIRRYQSEEEMLGHDDLLSKMREALAAPAFAGKIRELFGAAIVDEFQDTDPVQWKIFSTLFLDKETPWNGYLYLVGDPKQSIYAFRQADIYTYLNAADRLGEGAIATLDTNFRSQPGLIQGLNALFSSVDNLFPLPKRGSTLPYRAVKAGRGETKQFGDALPSLQFWVAEGEGKCTLKECESEKFFPQIAAELKRLRSQDGISFGQCAILIGDRYQAARLNAYLKEEGIPVRAQKVESLADSPAVEAMREIIDGILHYKRGSALKIALAGPIIGTTDAQLQAMIQGNSQGMSGVVTLCDTLRRTLVEEGFAPFYRQLMESQWSHLNDERESAKSLREKMLSRENAEAFCRDWEQVAELLISEEVSKGHSPSALIDLLDKFEFLETHGDERMKGYVDPDEEGVAVLTTHSSKGLEYDVVFALGLINRTTRDEELLLIDDGVQHLAALEKEDPRYERYCQEIDAEKMRQLYVALTRAKYRLYIPVALLYDSGATDRGRASPIELLLARLNQKGIDYAAMYQRIASPTIDSLAELVRSYPSLMDLKILDQCSNATPLEAQSEMPLLLPPPRVAIPGVHKIMQSFTSLSHAIQGAYQGSYQAEPQEGDPQAAAVPHNAAAEVKTEHTLPSSKETGVLLHHLLETIPFTAVKGHGDPSCLLPFVREAIVGTPYAPWDCVIAKILFRTLTTPLGNFEQPFCLADIDPKRIYRETEFTYPCAEGKMEGMRHGFLKGVIDLAFEYQGKYYLLDWKSNWLGPNTESYHPEALDRAMRENQYDLQAKLYSEAYRRYLALFGVDFDADFGGAYYLFLRGIGPNTGIWHSSRMSSPMEGSR